MKHWFNVKDGNFLKHGGTWFYKSSYENYYIAVELLNWEDAVGTHEAKEVGFTYNVEVSYIFPELCSFENIRQALDFVGSLQNPAEDITPQELIWALYSAGLKDVQVSKGTNNAYKTLREHGCYPR